MKLAPVARRLRERPDVRHYIVHTGQHYDRNMSATFFEDLGVPEPDRNLDVGSGSHAQQTAAIMQRLEPVILELAPDVVLVYGDVNSTVAAALVATKLGIRVGHVEAGLRSGDWSMPEEINRVVTDRLSDLLFVPSRDAIDNLIREGVPRDRIHFVGNVMIDSLVSALPAAGASDVMARHGLENCPYALVTLHRPSNVDLPEQLLDLLRALSDLASDVPVVFPMHPRTKARVADVGWSSANGADLRIVDPVSYLEMLSLATNAALVITDSGGLQEETSYLNVPCLTVRPNTERPVTCTHGTNRLVEPTYAGVLGAAKEVLGASRSQGAPIERWDGRAGERVVEVVCDAAAFTD
jgi:UDP-N-acetylglucosamine 2-epimerase (non-hydrolysing)